MTATKIRTEPVDGRSCGGCTLCCKIFEIEALKKPQGIWCVHCEKGVGCRIYEGRPNECRTFLCGWLIDERFGPEWKPNKSKLIITSAPDGNGLDFRCDPGYPDAWRREPYYSAIIRIAKAAAPTHGTVMICVGNKRTLITPEREFSLGEVGADQKIVREFSGGRVVNVRVVKADQLNK